MKEANTGQATRATAHAPWWRGTRGEWHVVAQLALIALVLFGPPTWPRAGLRAFQYADVWPAAGLVLVVAGVMLIAAGGLWLGRRNLTPLPAPREQATMVDSGPYRLVRHPMYAGGILIGCGWTLWVRGPLTLIYTLLLVLFVDVKSRREERWLRAKFPGYAAYQARVRKLVPFVY
jgi:protein-S-isoprenylcysteine O-methyltransferase Ste14